MDEAAYGLALALEGLDGRDGVVGLRVVVRREVALEAVVVAAVAVALSSMELRLRNIK